MMIVTLFNKAAREFLTRIVVALYHVCLQFFHYIIKLEILSSVDQILLFKLYFARGGGGGEGGDANYFLLNCG